MNIFINKRILPFVLSVLWLISPGRTHADHPGDAIFETFGYLRDNLGNPVPGINVVGDNYNGDNYPSVTDSNGLYVVAFPIDGNYRIQVDCNQLSALGYGCVPSVAVAQEADPIQHDFIVSPSVGTLRITNASLPKANVTASYHVQLGAAGGQPPYTWQLASDSPNLPPGLSLNASGLIFGTPTTNNQFAIKVQVTDASSAVTNKILFLTVNRQPTLLTPVWKTNRFSMRLFAAADQNYTIQTATNLNSTNWTSLFVTNNLNSSSYLVFDPQATNSERFYRVLIGP